MKVGAKAKEEESEETTLDVLELKTLQWEVDRLTLDCGFNEFQAAALAAAGVSWHDALPLIKRGCSHETAVDLLL